MKSSLGVAVVLLLVALQPGSVQVQTPAVRLVSPVEGGYVSGDVVMTAVVEAAAQDIECLQFFADGTLVCTVERPPWVCAWNAGSQIRRHLIRVVVHLGDGRRLVDNVRTEAVEYAEAVDVDVVQVTVTVLDGSRFVRGLSRDAFRVYEDDVRQPILHFAAEGIPLELVTAIDISESMTGAIGQVRESVKLFLAALRPEDRVTLVAFNENIFVVGQPATDLAFRLDAVDQLMPWGATALHDVILRSFELLGRQAGRHGVVVFTDGDDTASRARREAVERRAETSDAILYMIGQGRAVDEPALKQLCEHLAARSGGRAYFPRRPEDVGDAFTAIVQELSNQYLLTYAPPSPAHDEAWHRIRVEVAGGRYEVRARQGYRMAGR